MSSECIESVVSATTRYDVLTLDSPLQKVGCRGFLLHIDVSLYFVLYLWVALMELQLLNTEDSSLLTAFIFKHGQRTACFFDASLLQDFLIRRGVINIFKIGLEDSIGKKVRKGQWVYLISLFSFSDTGSQ